MSTKDEGNFNSSMVRLKGFLQFPDHVPSDISIPLWCDLKTLITPVTTPANEFQFLYGAIKSELRAIKVDVTAKFQFLYGAIKSNNVYKITTG